MMVKRYDLTICDNLSGIKLDVPFATAVRGKDGEYVKYDDVKHLLERADNEDCTTRNAEDEYIERIMGKVNAEQEYLCAAFLKETGLSPEDCTICHQTKDGVSRIWIERKDVRD